MRMHIVGTDSNKADLFALIIICQFNQTAVYVQHKWAVVAYEHNHGRFGTPNIGNCGFSVRNRIFNLKSGATVPKAVIIEAVLAIL